MLLRHVLALAAAAVAGCSSQTTPAAAPATSTPAPAKTADNFPEPPPFTHTIDGKEITVLTTSADPTDLLNTYNKVARTLRPTLAEGGYWIRIDCSLTDAKVRRLANGTLGIGKLGTAQVGDYGSFKGAISGAHCP
ncbi:hypothetical protein [Nocardia niigatensis]